MTKEKCIICQDEILLFKDKKTLYCEHIFHKTCIEEYIKYNSNNKYICPLCKKYSLLNDYKEEVNRYKIKHIEYLIDDIKYKINKYHYKSIKKKHELESCREYITKYDICNIDKYELDNYTKQIDNYKLIMNEYKLIITNYHNILNDYSKLIEKLDDMHIV